MAIKASCSNCNSSFKAKDSLAGRRVKCPKCGEKLTVPGLKVAAGNKTAQKKKTKTDPSAGSFNLMDELLDEANVRGKSKGPVCDDCGAELEIGATICIECGFNLETGSRLRTDAFDDEAGENDYGATSAEKMMRQAELDIAETPVTGDDQDFGDGAESLVIAGVAGIILVVLMAIALVIIYLMEHLSDRIHTSFISMVASILLAIGCIAWITIVAFLVKKSQGVICLATGGLYCIVFGFLQGKQLLLPTIVLLVSIFIAAASGFYYANYAPTL
jgi:DNA-directed RNA polymerase subunit M/transcription elongation factor TFIIS